MYHITLKSNNRKTGGIAVSTSPKSDCPPTCRFMRNGCYADSGPLAIHWDLVTRDLRGVSWGQFLGSVRQLPDGSLFRHNQAGDLPSRKGRINATKMKALVAAASHLRGFTYTHHLPTRHNSKAVAMANKAGFTVNLSADSATEADQLHALGIGPVVVVVPEATAPVTYTPAGRKIVVCPAQQREGITCKDCALCAVSTRSVIVGFRAHGSGKRKVEAVCEGGKR